MAKVNRPGGEKAPDEKAARAAGSSAADQAADATRASADAGADATRAGGEQLARQMNTVLDATSRTSQLAAQRMSENLELMKRLGETMASGLRETSAEMVDWLRRVTERQTEATRQITQARGVDEVLEVQSRYIRENLQGLLDVSAKVSRLSADKAKEASGDLDDPGRT
jgi:hypothetical protein